MTADSSSTATITHSGEDGGGDLNSPSGRRGLPSPWAQVVRGGTEPDSISPSPSPPPPLAEVAERNPVLSDPVTVVEPETAAAGESDGGNNSNAGGVKKSAWNKPSANGVVDSSTTSTTPVMGAASWPALSESTRSGVKSVSSSSSESSSNKPITDGSIAVSQAPAVLQPPQKHVRTNANSHSNPNPMNPVRQQRQMRRGGGGGGGAGGGSSTAFNRPPPPPPLPPPFPLFDMSYGNLVPAVLDSPVRDNYGPRNPTMRNNYGPRPRGNGGSFVNNGYGGNRDHNNNHDRDWRSPRNPGTRDVHIPHQMVPPPPPPVRGFIRPPHPGPAPFIPPQPLRPYGNPMGYEMAASYIYVPTLPPEPYRGAPLLPPHAPSTSMFMPIMDPPLHVLILNQIEYYFSDANLVKDNFLRSQMDEEGWVPIALIAGFRRVQSLTNDIQMILNSLRDSATVEVQGEKVRRRSEWRRWIQSSNRLQADTEAPILEETSVEKLSLEDKEVGTSDSHKLANGEVSSEDVSS